MFEGVLFEIGFVTTIDTVPTCADVAVPVATICVDVSDVTVSKVEPKPTVAPLTKLEPVIVSEIDPTINWFGVTDVICATGFKSVTALMPETVGLAVMAASTVTVFGDGRVAGAV